MATSIKKVSGVVNTVTTQNQYSASLDGSTDAYSHADDADLKPTSAFTIGAWVKGDSFATNARFIMQSYSENPNVAGWHLYVATTGAVKFASGKNTGGSVGTDLQVATGSTIATGDWFYIVATWDGSYLTAYVNGVAGTPVAWANAPVYAGTNYFRVGCGNYSGTDINFFDGNIDNAFIINGTALTQAQIATLMFQDLTGQTNLKGYWKFENNANDSSGNSHTLTNIGTPTYDSTVNSVFYTYYSDATENLGSMYFTTDDAISITDHTDLRPTTTYTIGCWIKTTTKQTAILVNNAVLNTGDFSGWYLYILSSDSGYVGIKHFTSNGSTAEASVEVANSTYYDGNWHFIVATYGGGTATLYMDGKVLGSNSISAPSYDTTSQFRIGCRYFNSANALFYTGYIDEVFLVNGTAWSQATIQSYLNKKIPTTSTNLKLLIDFEGNLTDTSGNSHDGTLISTPYYYYDQPFTTYNRKGLDLELSSSQYAYITDANQTGLDITGDISIEAWIKLEQLPSTATTEFAIAGKYDYNGNKRCYLLTISTADALYFRYSSDGTTSNFLATKASSATFVAGDVGNWVHVAVTVDVSSSTVTMYKNGAAIATSVDTDNGTHTSIADKACSFEVGSSDSGTDNYMDGVVDEVRVWNDIRTAEEIAANYKIMLTGSETNLAASWPFNGNYMDLTTNGNNLTPNASPVFTRIVPFDGSSSIKNISSNPMPLSNKVSGVQN